jgi:hypothetical protein
MRRARSASHRPVARDAGPVLAGHFSDSAPCPRLNAGAWGGDLRRCKPLFHKETQEPEKKDFSNFNLPSSHISYSEN